MKKLFFCWLFAVGATGLQAQQISPAPTASPVATPTLPPGPLIKPVPDRMSWIVTVTDKPDPNAKPAGGTKDSGKSATKPAARTISGEKAGSVVHVEMTTDNGTEEHWSDGKVQITTNAKWKAPLFSTGTPEEFPKPNWISRKNIKEIKKQGDKEYWVFRDRIFPGGENVTREMVGAGVNLEDLKVDATAVIDADTHLPAGVQSGDETTTYKFEPLPPNATLELPLDLQAAITERVQKIQATTRRGVRP